MCTAIVKYKLTNSLFPSVPFLGRFDYWNNLATLRKLTISPAMDAIRSRFHQAVEFSRCWDFSITLNLPVDTSLNEIPAWVTETIPLSAYEQDFNLSTSLVKPVLNQAKHQIPTVGQTVIILFGRFKDMRMKVFAVLSGGRIQVKGRAGLLTYSSDTYSLLPGKVRGHSAY
jgi:hypothetical protein